MAFPDLARVLPHIRLESCLPRGVHSGESFSRSSTSSTAHPSLREKTRPNKNGLAGAFHTESDCSVLAVILFFLSLFFFFVEAVLARERQKDRVHFGTPLSLILFSSFVPQLILAPLRNRRSCATPPRRPFWRNPTRCGEEVSAALCRLTFFARPTTQKRSRKGNTWLRRNARNSSDTKRKAKKKRKRKMAKERDFVSPTVGNLRFSRTARLRRRQSSLPRKTNPDDRDIEDTHGFQQEPPLALHFVTMEAKGISLAAQT